LQDEPGLVAGDQFFPAAATYRRRAASRCQSSKPMSAPPRTPWMVPRRRDPHFVGRQEELAALEAALGDGGTSVLSQPASVHGLGGVGKTLLAVEFAYRHAADYAAVLWLSAEEPTVLAAAFADLARELGLPEADKPDQGVRTAAVLRWLETSPSGRWLLVFDNAERRQDVEPYVPRRHAGHVLITSRAPDWAPLARPLKVRPLPRVRSVELLRLGLEAGDEAEAGPLAEALGDLPLALAQAAAFVRQTGCSFGEYLARFEARGAEFERVQGAEPGYGRTVGVALGLTLDRMQEGQQGTHAAETLLEHCAFYAPDHIPRALLADEFPEAVLDEAIGTLRGYALIETEAGNLSNHRLMQWAVRERMSPARQAEGAEHAVRKLRERFPADARDVRKWPACRQLLNHAIVAAEHAIGRQVGGPLVGELLNSIGIYLWSTYALAEARKQLGQALRIKEAAHGPEHLEVASTLNILGNVAELQGDLSGARALQERALRIKEAAYGPEHPEVAITLGNLGNVARLQGDLSGARALQERALRIKEAAYGPEHPAVARTLNNLGLVARDQGDLSGARALLERALRIKEAAHGPEHPEFANTLGNLGNVARQQGDLSGARALYERALRIEEATYGPEHPDVAIILNDLGLVAEAERDFPLARSLFERALTIFHAALGDEHPHTIEARAGLGRLEAPQPAEGRAVVDLTGAQLAQLTDALVAAFTPQTLEEMLRVRREKNLGSVVSLSLPMRQVVFQLLQAAEREGWTQELIAAAHQFNPGNAALRRFCEQHVPAALSGRGAGDSHGQDMNPPSAAPSQPEADVKPTSTAAKATPPPTIGIITALPHETAAIRAVFGDPPRLDVPGSGAGRAYWRAEVPAPLGGTHRVLIAQADMGNNIAAVRATLLLSHFPMVESIVMCGIAGGIPSPQQPADCVYLGDVVVSNHKGVVQYDFGKRTRKKQARVLEEVRAAPRPPSALLLEAVRILESDVHLGRYPWEARLQEGTARLNWARPDASTDPLAAGNDPTPAAPQPADDQRRPGQPRIFLGPIASANTLLKDPGKRDALRAQFGARAVEMEGSGIADATWNQGVGYLVVRGICDYCDASKNDVWQRYAALAAAAYVRALLDAMPGTAVPPP
jgi:nucleoside phosphorylase/Tfp pilus assembly protein PilF